MSWNYRVFRKVLEDDECYEIREVYYDKEGNINGYTEKGIAPCGYDLKQLKADIELMKLAFNQPILEEPIKSD